MRGWLLIPVGLIAAVVVLLPAAALTDTSVEEEIRGAVGFDQDECRPSVNAVSPWLKGPELGSDRDEPRAIALDEHVGAAVAGGDLYVLGGRTDDSLAVPTAERYDLRENRWERLTPMPVPSGGLSAVGLNGRAIAIGGGDDGADTVTGAVQEFDPSTGEWKLLPELRTPRHGHGAAVAAGRIWAFGGSDCAYFNPTSDVEALPLRLTSRLR